MDPGLFTVLFAHAAQQQQLVQAAVQRARQEAEEQNRQAVLMQHRRELLAAVGEETGELSRAASARPMQAYVHLQIMLNHLDRARAVPESFEEGREREDVTLLWRQLLNLVAKTQAGMTPDQQAQCHKCVQAIAMRNFIQYTSQQIGPYQAFLEVKNRWERAHDRDKTILSRRRAAHLLVTGLALASFIPFAAARGLDFAAAYLLLWVLTALTASLAVHLVLESRRPKNLPQLDLEYNRAYRAASIDNEGYWKAVRDTFDGVPTPEQLERARAEQEPVIRAIFGEETSDTEEAAGQMADDARPAGEAA